ncbi:hypothetical protein [Prevotella sp. HUN102]|uniref:hypothetical protein n=1 Tax=Prevotella sp. HUN102 TaxID=1392486 RepID=UPI000A786CB6|nr:hypothetical protein [Prevotella sp. HUN102]
MGKVFKNQSDNCLTFDEIAVYSPIWDRKTMKTLTESTGSLLIPDHREGEAFKDDTDA